MRFSGGPVPVPRTIRATFILAVLRALASQGVPERHQELPLLVPEGEPRAFQAVDKGEASGVAKLGILVKAFAQAIVRYLAADVMDVVEANMARQPVQHRRQIVEGAALQRCYMEIPIRAGRPIGVLELVLNVKQPQAG